jgi:hypothetical protein
VGAGAESFLDFATARGRLLCGCLSSSNCSPVRKAEKFGIFGFSTHPSRNPLKKLKTTKGKTWKSWISKRQFAENLAIPSVYLDLSLEVQMPARASKPDRDRT